MKKIVVLASLLVSLSFGANPMGALGSLFSDVYAKPMLKQLQQSGGKPCKSVQDKVDGCYTVTYRKDGGIDQIVIYEKKKIGIFIRIYYQAYPPMEKAVVTCVENGSNGTCTIQDTNGKKEEVKGEWNKLVKDYLKQ